MPSATPGPPTPSARGPRRIENPVLGDAVTFLETSEESGGERTLIEIDAAPGGGTMPHYHLTYSERFRVREGRLTVEVDGARNELGAGDEALAAAGSLHRWRNLGAEPCAAQVELRPGHAGFEAAMRVGYALAREGRVLKNGTPRNPLYTALLLEWSRSACPGSTRRSSVCSGCWRSSLAAAGSTAGLRGGISDPSPGDGSARPGVDDHHPRTPLADSRRPAALTGHAPAVELAREGCPPSRVPFVVTTTAISDKKDDMKSRAKPRDRPHPPRAHSRCQDPLARGARRGGGGLARGEHPGRAARAPVHVLPSRAGYRSPGGADSADARRPHDRRDRARLPRLARDDVAAALAGEGEDQGGRDPVQGSVGPPAAGAPGGGVAEVQSPEAALESLERLEVDDYQYLHSTRAELLRRLGRSEEARAAYRRALALAGGRPERRFLEARLAALERGSGHGAPKAR